jgi:hypothetical protein
MGIDTMASQWISSSAFLPHTGEAIDFLLKGRDVPIHGKFDGGVFHSRWADYESERVGSWRQALIDPSHEAIGQLRVAGARRKITTVGRIARWLVGRNQFEPAVFAGSHNRRTARPAHSLTAATDHAMPFQDSNQLSSQV